VTLSWIILILIATGALLGSAFIADQRRWSAVVGVGAVSLGAAMILAWADTDRPTPAPVKVEVDHRHGGPGPVIVVPTCAELDTYGYDGDASCWDSDGELVHPGSDDGS
jgi:hypothetical protein